MPPQQCLCQESRGQGYPGLCHALIPQLRPHRRHEHHKVKEAAVIGLPDEKRGETVKVFIVLKEEQPVTAEEIMIFYRERMASYKAPA